jgi:microcystin degradation protein MlrC
MAVLAIGGVRVVVTSTPMQAFDPAPFHHVGIEPADVDILVLKSTCHFRADFGPLARQILLVAAPGACLADPRQCAYRWIRPGLRLMPAVGPGNPT